MKHSLENIESITELIPHRLPVICVDRLLAVDEKSATSSFTIPEDFIFIKNDRISAAGLLENVAQTAAAKAGYFHRLNNSPVTPGYIAAIKQVEISHYPKIGLELISQVEFIQLVMNMSIFRFEIKCRNRIVLTGEMNIIIQDTMPQ